MAARVVPPYPDDPEYSSMSTHIECDECHTEWGWGRDLPAVHDRLDRMVAIHNVEYHGYRRFPDE